jgi:hypothetical protein
MEYDLELEDSACSKDTKKKASTYHRLGPGWPGAIIMSLVISLAVSVITTKIYDVKYAQKVVSLDIKGYVAKQGEAYMTGKITEDQFHKSFDHLQKVVEAIPPNKAVLLGDLVVRNVEKISPE